MGGQIKSSINSILKADYLLYFVRNFNNTLRGKWFSEIE